MPWLLTELGLSKRGSASLAGWMALLYKFGSMHMNGKDEQSRSQGRISVLLKEHVLEDQPPHAAEGQDTSDRVAPTDKSALLGIAIVSFGIILPTLALSSLSVLLSRTGIEIMLRHPVEALCEYALACLIPIGNLVVWRRIRANNFANAIRLGLLNGVSIGSALMITALCAAANLMVFPSIDERTGVSFAGEMSYVGYIAFFSAIVSVYLLTRLRAAWETNSAKNRQLGFSIAGTLLSLLAVGACEARSVAIRVNEQAAITDNMEQRQQALTMLRTLGSEREIKLDIADPRSAGLSGMFWPVDAASRRQLYFAVSSKPYQTLQELAAFDDVSSGVTSNSYDRFLASHVVGDAIPNFSLHRSKIAGTLNAKTLTSKLDWTLVFRNKNNVEQEGRAEIALPPGAVVQGMCLWMNGKPSNARIGTTEQAEGAYRWVVEKKRDPALLTYLGNGRVLLHCYPVPANKELKVAISMVAPMKLDNANHSSLTLPRILAGNFGSAKSHELRLSANNELSLDCIKEVKKTTENNHSMLSGTIPDEQLSKNPLSVVASRPTTVGAFAAQDPIRGGYAVESVKEHPNSPPSRLVVAIDGSGSMHESAQSISKMLTKVSHMEIPTTVIIADNDSDEAPESLTISEALDKLKEMKFVGGHDNLPAVIKATEIAGEAKNGAVFWIHGPQPAFNEEIYITSNAISKPAIYELPIDDGWTNTSEFFRNHKEIGKPIPVTRNGELSKDLENFVSQWNPGHKHFAVDITHFATKPDCPIIVGEEAQQLTLLSGAQYCKQLMTTNKADAARTALNYYFVSPVTSAVVLEFNSDYQAFGLNQRVLPQHGRQRQARPAQAQLANHDSLSNFGGEEISTAAPPETAQTLQGATSGNRMWSAAPSLQGATNGTIGPQGSDAIYITGLNTAGTVRVNNLANLEMWLNVLANACECLGIASGIAFIIMATRRGNRFKYATLGATLIVFGLSAPSFVNYVVATGRDANLFN